MIPIVPPSAHPQPFEFYEDSLLQLAKVADGDPRVLRETLRLAFILGCMTAERTDAREKLADSLKPFHTDRENLTWRPGPDITK